MHGHTSELDQGTRPQGREKLTEQNGERERRINNDGGGGMFVALGHLCVDGIGLYRLASSMTINACSFLVILVVVASRISLTQKVGK